MVSLKGLDPATNYSIFLRMVSADQYRYKFLSMHWVPVGESEVIQNEERQIYCHPNSPNSGQFWMKKPISFKSVKITHNSSSKNGNVSGHMIQPVTYHDLLLTILVACTALHENATLLTFLPFSLSLYRFSSTQCTSTQWKWL